MPEVRARPVRIRHYRQEETLVVPQGSGGVQMKTIPWYRIMMLYKRVWGEPIPFWLFKRAMRYCSIISVTRAKEAKVLPMRGM